MKEYKSSVVIKETYMVFRGVPSLMRPVYDVCKIYRVASFKKNWPDCIKMNTTFAKPFCFFLPFCLR